MTNLDKIFRAYDVRGVYPSEINEVIAYKIGRSVARFLKAKEIIIGRDARLSSESLLKVLCKGVHDEGVNVVDIGLATTPMFYFAVVRLKFKGGIMITASHNPPEYNGFKIVNQDAMPVGNISGLDKIKSIFKKEKSAGWPKNKNKGQTRSKEIMDNYIKNILRFRHVKNIGPLKIVVDTTNGTAGLIIPKIFKKTSIKLIHIFSKIDGSFPGHGPNPLIPKNTKDLQKRVLLEKADLGVAFDGDGDRILFIDEKGKRIEPDLIAALLIHHFFRRSGEILYTPIANHIVKEEIEDSGNTPVPCRVGYTFIKRKMQEEKIVFGTESSGHYYLKDNYFIESPFFVLFKVLEIISKTKMPLSELMKPFQKYYLERENFKCENSKKIIKKIEKNYKKGGKLSRLDGLTIEFKDWWFNLRCSNTEPILRFTIEAKTKKLLEQNKKEITELIQSFS